MVAPRSISTPMMMAKEGADDGAANADSLEFSVMVEEISLKGC